MEAISLKLDEHLLKEIDDSLSRHRYANRTEFIRDAIREKLVELEKQESLRQIAKLRGSSKRRTTDEQLHEAGEKVFEAFEKKFNL